VAGATDEDEHSDLFLYDRVSGAVSLVSFAAGSPGVAANRWDFEARISADGSVIAFNSASTDLVPGQTASESVNLILQDRSAGTRTFVGRVHTSRPFAVSNSAISFLPQLSANGRAVAFTSDVASFVAGDFNGTWDAFLYDADGSTGGGPFGPCTLLDTRRAADGPALRSDVRRTLSVHGACGVPTTAKTVSVKVTVLQSSGKGNLRFYPGNVPSTAQPSATLRFQKGKARSASLTLSLATNGAGTLAILPFVAGEGTVHMIVEVNGYSP
jgi:hypothetical protein